MSISIGNICIDTNDLGRSTAFWQAVTGYQVASSDEGTTYLEDANKSGVGLSLQAVPEGREGKNRLHLDLFTDDLAGEADRIQALGASEVRRFDSWVVLADPEGNQFCVVAA
ncbi:VOC family protein [Herbidospora sp. NEAU-GS84]|uniref:VOC family protein n=1 Tax=Herbidospora solisilvae TaxID=2696284 RepID=A0A7C9J651_9ACTN|nr:VOC family protein [Herbidospora solisilvae]NAS25727.1 VOC family protein [Herbidospora solisilvae]